jgi:hypothetical protein
MKTREDVVHTIYSLFLDLKANPDAWENPTLGRFLEAMGAWLDSARISQVAEPSWDLICDLLEAGKIYE